VLDPALFDEYGSSATDSAADNRDARECDHRRVAPEGLGAFFDERPHGIGEFRGWERPSAARVHGVLVGHQFELTADFVGRCCLCGHSALPQAAGQSDADSCPAFQLLQCEEDTSVIAAPPCIDLDLTQTAFRQRTPFSFYPSGELHIALPPSVHGCSLGGGVVGSFERSPVSSVTGHRIPPSEHGLRCPLSSGSRERPTLRVHARRRERDGRSF